MIQLVDVEKLSVSFAIDLTTVPEYQMYVDTDGGRLHLPNLNTGVARKG